MTNSATQQLANGTLIKDRYEVVRLLGAGGMGAVYEARDRVLDKRIALKILHREIAQDSQMNARFVQEARAASAFKHRHVVESLDFGTHDGAPFLVMEFLEGESFSSVLEREKVLTPARAVELLEPIARALARAHTAGIIHRDVKPDNVFLAKGDDGECVPKLVDFGIAKRTNESEMRLTKTSVAMGTPFYMPPEQAMGARDVTAAADQYAFAAMVYEAVSGKFPHDGESYNALIINKVTKDAAPLLEAAPGIDPAFAAIVMKALAREPSARYASMAELREALAGAVGLKIDGGYVSTGNHPVVDVPDRGGSTAKALPSVKVSTSDAANRTTTDPGAANKDTLLAHSVAGVERPSGLTPAPKKSNSALIVGSLVVVALLGGGGFAMSRSSSTAGSINSNPGPTVATRVEPRARHTLRVSVTPSTATIRINGRELGRGNVSFETEAGTDLELRVQADGYGERSESFRLTADRSVELVLAPQGPTQPVAGQAAADAGVVAAQTGPSNGQPGGRPGRNPVRNPGRTGVQLGRTGVSLDLSLTGGR
ncbi:MAG: serine/threonine protein kinase [Myxococcales bacterium]|nr:serine/threonine protein kinase [Myxococcales bacterium]